MISGENDPSFRLVASDPTFAEYCAILLHGQGRCAFSGRQAHLNSFAAICPSRENINFTLINLLVNDFPPPLSNYFTFSAFKIEEVYIQTHIRENEEVEKERTKSSVQRKTY